MSRKKDKTWAKLTAITDEWIKASYPNTNGINVWHYKDRVNQVLEFIGLTDAEFLETFKSAPDKLEWAKQYGQKAIAFYNDKVSQGKKTNTVRAVVSTFRAFCRDNATLLTIQRKKIAKSKSAKGEHEFTREELAKMFYVADVRGKAVLSTAVSLGFSVEDFSELKRDYIESLVNKALNEKIDFIGFDYERGKTGVESRSHLTPESVSSLKAWFEYIDAKRKERNLDKSEWVWCNGNHGNLNEQTLNDIIKDLVKKANVSVTGTIRFHLLRKFLMNTLHDAGFDSWETKRALGKEIATSDETYLRGLSRRVSEKFPQAYERIKLIGYANHNHTRIEEMQTELDELKTSQQTLLVQNETLMRLLMTTNADAVKNALSETIRRLPDMTPEKYQNIQNLLKTVRTEEDIEQLFQNMSGLYGSGLYGKRKSETDKDKQ